MPEVSPAPLRVVPSPAVDGEELDEAEDWDTVPAPPRPDTSDALGSELAGFEADPPGDEGPPVDPAGEPAAFAAEAAGLVGVAPDPEEPGDPAVPDAAGKDPVLAGGLAAPAALLSPAPLRTRGDRLPLSP